MNLQAWPVLRTPDGEEIVPKAALLQLWEDITPERRQACTLAAYPDAETFADAFLGPGVHPVLIWDTTAGRPVFLAWLTNVENGWAHAHFCGVGPYRKGAAETVLDFWGRLPLTGILGVIPVTNRKGVHLAEMMGWVRVGEVPMLFNGETPGVFFYHLLKGRP